MEISDKRPAKMRKLNLESDGASANLHFLTDISRSHPNQEPSSPISNSASSQIDNGHENYFSPSEIGASEKIDAKDLPKTLSKSQLKKLKKRQHWEEGREYRKVKRRETNARRKAKKAAERKALSEIPGEVEPKVQKRATQLPISFILDCDFDNLMTDKEIMSLGSQLTRCYSDNKNAPYKSHLTISSFGGQLKERFEGILASHHLGWRGVGFTEENFIVAANTAHELMYGPEGGEVAGALARSVRGKGKQEEIRKSQDVSLEETCGKVNTGESVEVSPSGSGIHSREEQDATIKDGKDLDLQSQPMSNISQPTNVISPLVAPPKPSTIYLSSDSPHTLECLSPYTNYVIGGLVDKNRHKGICYKKACELGIPTAKLPIGEYMDMQSRTVLTTNHVVEIMIRWLEVGDWGEAFLKVIPKRKEAKLKDKGRGVKAKIESVGEGNEHGFQAEMDLLEEESGGDQDSQNGEDSTVNTSKEES